MITRLVQPGGPGIREDCAVFAGWTVPLDYDPMLSKLVAFAQTREMAIDRMLRALDEYVIGGIKTNIGLFRRILTDAGFSRGANRYGVSGATARGWVCGGCRRLFRRIWWRWQRLCFRRLRRERDAVAACCGGEPMGRDGAAGGIAAVTVWLEVGGKKVRVELPSGVASGVMECFVDGRAMGVNVRMLEPGVMSLVVGWAAVSLRFGR